MIGRRRVLAHSAFALVVWGLAGCCASGNQPRRSENAPAAVASSAPVALAASVRNRPNAVVELTVASSVRASFRPPLGDRVVVFVHRWGADRSEFAPVLAKLDPALGYVAPDIGRAAAALQGPAQVDSRTREALELAGTLLDVVKDIDARLQKPVRYTFVGSSFGATLAVLAARNEPRVISLALISPGAGIRGVDLYRPYADVRHRPTFIARARADTISEDAAKTLPKMEGTRMTVVEFDGEAHGAEALGRSSPEFWEALASFLNDEQR